MTAKHLPRWPEQAARFACEVPRPTVVRVAAILANGDLARARAALSGDAARLFGNLLDAWAAEVPVGGPAVLVDALLAASEAERLQSGKQQLELVWSGPSTLSSALRSTGPALLELIAGAHESLYLVTFAAYKVPAVAEALVAAERRGVRVIFVLESEEGGGGKIDFAPLPHLRAAGLQQPEVYRWPVESRLRDERGRYGSLHAKFAVADRKRLLVSSANLTEFAFNLNIELGVLIDGGHAPAEAARQIDELLRLEILKQAE
jgi:cardiolipin synthase